MSEQSTHKYQFGPFQLDPQERLLQKDGQTVPLTPKALDTLLLLVEHRGQMLSKQQLIDSLWPDAFIEEANLTNNVSLLRKVLGDSSEEPLFIETVPRRGYRFIAAVKTIEPAASDSDKGLKLMSKRRRILFRVSIAAALLLAIAAAWIVLARLSRPTATLPFSERNWVLITSFDNRTGETLFDGTIESALERELSDSRFVNVTSPERAGDVLRLMEKPTDTKITATLGREICLRDGGIRALLAGRVEKMGTTYVMSVSLVDPFRDQTVAATSEAADQETIWPAVRRLSNWVRTNLGEALPSIQQSGEALEKVTTPSLRALQLYTQAMVLVNDSSRKTVGAAEQELRQAISEDPEFSSAYIMLAFVLKYQKGYSEDWTSPSQRAFELLGRTSERERYFIEGTYYTLRDQHEKAVSAYEALVQRYPDHFWGRHNLAWTYFYLGRWQAYIAQFALAAELRPTDLHINRLAAWNLLQIDMDEARRVVERATKVITPEMSASHPTEVAWLRLFPIHDFWVRGDTESAFSELNSWAKKLDSMEGAEKIAFAKNIANCYLAFGKLKTAEEFFEQLPKTAGRDSSLAVVAYDADDKEKFREYLRRHFDSSNIKNHGTPVHEGMLLLKMGIKDEARRNEINRLLAEGKKKPESKTEFGQASIGILEGELALSQGQAAEAVAHLQDAVSAVRYNSTDSFFKESESLANALELLGDLQKAVQVLERATQDKAIAYEDEGSTGDGWLRARWRLAELYRKLNRLEAAEKTETELTKMLAHADANHPILLRLKQVGNLSSR